GSEGIGEPLRREDLTQVVTVEGGGVPADHACEADRRIKVRLRDADLGALRRGLQFRGSHAGVPAQQIGRYADKDLGRRDWYSARLASHERAERLRRHAEQDPERVFALLQLDREL